MYDGRQLLCFSSIREKITFNENALLRDQRKKWVLLENQHYILNIEDIFTKFTGHPMNWTNMMSSKGQVYAIKIVDFISKTEGPLYFEQVGIHFRLCLCVCLSVRGLQSLPFDLGT